MDETLYRFGRCEVRPLSREVLLDGKARALEPKIFDVLLYLIEQRARVVGKEELLDVFWRDRGVSVGVVTRAVMVARQAIGDGGRGSALIRTLHRTGYRFVADVQASGAASGPESGTGDDLAGQALARATQATAEQKWRTAAHLLHVVLEAEPQNLAVRLEHLNALASLADAQAVALGRQLLSEPDVRAEPLRQASVHQALGTAYHHLRLFAEATAHLDEALRLSQGLDRLPWVATAVLLRSSIAIGQMDLQTAGMLLERARDLCERSGDPSHRLGWMVNTALVAAKSGELARAVDVGRDAVELCRQHRLHSYLAVTSLNLSHACLGRGLLRSAVRHAEESMATAQSLGERFRTASAGDTLSLLYRQLGATHDLQRVASQVQLIEHELAPPAQAYLQMAQGHLAALEQRHDDAARCFGKAVALARGLGEWLQAHESMPWLIAALIRSGQPDAAEAAWQEANALPEAAHDAELRAALWHCRAVRAHSRGRRDDALRLLRDCIETAPGGLWRAHACLDSAWLHLEDGDLDSARALLPDLGAWLTEHPAGQLVQARLLIAQGERLAAIEPQPRGLAAGDGVPHRSALALADSPACARTARSGAPARLPWLLTRA